MKYENDHKSGCFYFKQFIEKDSLEEYKDHLLSLEWQTKRTARHEYFMSDLDLSYSYGRESPDQPVYTTKPMTEILKDLTKRLNEECRTSYNGIFLNKYDNEQQHLGWHADDFAGMDQNHAIAVISFGAEREIWTKPQGFSGKIPEEWKFKLEEGSLFIMPRGFQATHFHRIPKHSQPCGWRISLTFRKFI